MSIVQDLTVHAPLQDLTQLLTQTLIFFTHLIYGSNQVLKRLKRELVSARGQNPLIVLLLRKLGPPQHHIKFTRNKVIATSPPSEFFRWKFHEIIVKL